MNIFARIGRLKIALVIAAVFVLAAGILGPVFVIAAVASGSVNISVPDGPCTPGGEAGELVLEGTEDAKATAFMTWLMTNSFEGLSSKPMSKEQAAGVAGNVMQESGFNPSAVNEIGASGLFQWLGGRKTGLQEFASSKGKAWDDATTQMQWLAEELNSTHKHVSEAMIASDQKSAREWAKFWDDEFEISGNDQIEKRMSNAERYYNLDVGGGSGGGEDCDKNPNVGTDGWTSPVAPGTTASSEYGQRNGRLHEGIDLPQGCDATIYAAQSGTVRVAGSYYGYGNAVVIDHADGAATLYGHMPWDGRKVSVGDTVETGQPIGVEGNTGNSFGCHLHFEVHIDGVPIDPRPFMAERGIDFGPNAE